MNTKSTNRLKFEKSPYLIQHAHNPVDWYPWSDEAFEKARTEDRPIFLSIGYSTCHWCHVMERESFEDSEVARLINKTFVAIKVDREERPDIDGIYMSVCQMMTGSGGWPLTIIMTSDKQPFFAATYIPKETRINQIGLLELIPRVREVWSNRREEVLNSASEITTSLQSLTQSAPGHELNEETLHLTFRQLEQLFDNENGGFGGAPKFPTPHNILFLLRYYQRTRSEKALYMAEKTLKAMRRGGIYDHIGFGFHRYSTDSHWFVPHFEKMLYDQALMAMAYIEAYQATGREEYKETAHEVFTYVLRDMTSPEGGFYSAEDADSEGEEGKYYLWSTDEIREVLSKKEAGLAEKIYNFSEQGNFRDESSGEMKTRNILYTPRSPDEICRETGHTKKEFLNAIEKIRNKLFKIRNNRVRPHKDDKVLTDWNGLMIAALAKGSQVFNNSEYANAARRAIRFIFEKMRTSEGRLLHRYRDKEAAITAGIDDYAFTVYGLIELYEATFEADYLRAALQLCEDSLEHYWDEADGGFYSTADDSESLLVRRKEIYDGAEPSGNSIAMLNLLRLARITGRSDFEEKAHTIGHVFSGQVGKLPSSHTQLMTAIDFSVGPSYDVIIAGNLQAPDTRHMLDVIRRLYLPRKVVILRGDGDENDSITEVSPYIHEYRTLDGKATAYICINHSCRKPTTDIDTMLDLLGSGSAPEKISEF